jgi:hypothetical protein
MTTPACTSLRRFILLLCCAAALTLCRGTSSAADLPIYADGLGSGWSDWSWGTSRNLANASPVRSGTRSISVAYTAAWAGLYLHAAPAVDLGGYDRLRFWIHGGSAGNQHLRVVVNGDDVNTFQVTAQADTWTEVSVPLSALGSPLSLSDIYWQDTTGGAQPVYYLDEITLVEKSGPPAPGPALRVNVRGGRHPINDDIYGMNFADEELATALRLPVRRWGGNSTSRYNWETSMYNTGSDWYFENIPDGEPTADGSLTDRFADQDRSTGARTILTVPLIGWTPRSDSSRVHPYACGFRVSTYGPQQSIDSWDPDCGNGLYPDGSPITGNDPADTGTPIDPSFVTGWLNHLTAKYGTAANGGIAYYNLDNEPMLWNSTHRDVHPDPATYDELRDRTWLYAAALKAADPSARTLGPVLWGWCAYFYSALDDCAPGADYHAHGDTHFVPWYLRQMKDYQEQHGVRLLDYLDLHYYPQAVGVALSSAGDASTRALRLRSTRSLWDPTYADESWISDMGLDGGVVRLIPRMKAWVNDNYPGTRLAITEYNWGALDDINGALAQADVLGIFGREGLDLATLWAPPESGQPGAFAFRMYRNYDGAGSGFGDIALSASSSDQDSLAVYAALRRSDRALTVMVINKSNRSQAGNLSLSGIAPAAAASVYRYGPADLNAVERLADQPVTAGGFSADFPANSITLFVIRGNSHVPNDFDGDGRSDIAVYRPSEGNWYLVNSSTGGKSVTNFGGAGDIPVSGDFDGDTRSDAAVWRSGVWFISTSSDGSQKVVNYGTSGDTPVPGDYDGDGKTDPAVWRNGVWFISTSSDGSQKVVNYGTSGDIPVPGDYDGDGKTDPAVWRGGTWFISTSSDGSQKVANYGTSGDIPVPGDYDGDGKTDPAVWRGGTWFISTSSDGSQKVASYGTSGDIPVPGDFDGDARNDLALFRPSSGNWHILESSSGSQRVVNWGISSDLPVGRVIAGPQ